MEKNIRTLLKLSILWTILFIFSVPSAEAKEDSMDSEKFVPLLASEQAALQSLYTSRGSSQGTYVEQKNGRITSLEIYDTTYVEEWVFPVEIATLSTLESIQIDGAKLTEALPPALFMNPALKKLTLKNYTCPLPEKGLEKSALENISFYSCSLSVLPENMGSMPALRSLYVYKGGFSVLPESFGNLPRLDSLDIRDTPLQSLPASLGNIKTLKRLRVYAGKLTALPESFGSLPVLTEAFFAGNSIASLPSSMAGCLLLKELDFGANALGQSDLSALRTLPALESLNLYKNGFSGEIPILFFSLPKLTHLNLSGNNFSGNVPDALMASSVRSLILTENPQLKGEMLPFFTGKGMDVMVIEKTDLTFAPEDLAAYNPSHKRKKLWEEEPRKNPVLSLAPSFLQETLPLFTESTGFSSDWKKMSLWGEDIAFMLNVDMGRWIEDLDMRKTIKRAELLTPFVEKNIQQLNTIGKESIVRSIAEFHIDSVLAYSYYGLMEDRGDYPIHTAADLIPYLFIENVYMEIEEPLENPSVSVSVCTEPDDALFGGHRMCVRVQNGIVTVSE